MFSMFRSAGVGVNRCIISQKSAAAHAGRISSLRHNSSLVDRFKAVPPHSLAMLVFPCFTLYLGVWQVRRRKWKLALIEELDRKRRLPGEEIPYDLSEITHDKEYEPFILHGEFDHSREIHIGPRMLLGDDSAGGLLSNNNSIGVHVVTPFKLRDRNEEVLVNRGWVSLKQKKEKDIDRPKGEQRVVGIYRNKEKGGGSGADINQIYDRRTDMWSRRLVPLIADELGTESIFFDMAESKYDVVDINSPIPGQTIVQLRNEHLSYLITWFTLTIAMSIIWWKRHMTPKPKINIQAMMEENRKIRELQNKMNGRDQR